MRARPRSPRELFGELFVDAQRSHVTLDNKSFADAVPRMTPRAIRAAYRREQKKLKDSFSIGEFVRTYFSLPEETDIHTPREPRGMRHDIAEYIEETWAALTREADTHDQGSLIPLPRRYVVPGGRFRELYYWDSYFTMVGLLESGRVGLVEDMVENFASLIERFGHIPNGTRTYYLTRSNQPFFALMVRLLADARGAHVLTTYRHAMETEYAFWMRGAARAAHYGAAERAVRMPGGEILNRFWDASDLPREEMLADDLQAEGANATRSPLYRNLRAAAESGWDFSSRYLKDPTDIGTALTTDVVPVDLNALLALYENIIADAYEHAGRTRSSDIWRTRALARTEAMRTYLWSEKHGWYMDYRIDTEEHSDIVTAAGSYALWAGIATATQAARMQETIACILLRDGGVVSTPLRTGQQWDAPNGWAPLQYVTVLGLERYGYRPLAEEIAHRWITTVKRLYKRFGALLEKYNVEDTHELAGGGEYGIQDGFGWTNAVTLHFMKRYGISGVLEED